MSPRRRRKVWRSRSCKGSQKLPLGRTPLGNQAREGKSNGVLVGWSAVGGTSVKPGLANTVHKLSVESGGPAFPNIAIQLDCCIDNTPENVDTFVISFY